MFNYVFWDTEVEPGYCGLEALQGAEQGPDLRKGVEIQSWPENASLSMDPAYPKAKMLADNVYNLNQLPIVSTRLKELIEGFEPPKVQYLPVNIIDHKGRVASNEHFVINAFDVQDCINLDQSEITWNALDPERITACDELVLDESRINPEVAMFRAKYLLTRILVRRDLADRIAAADFVGVSFTEIEDIEI